MVTRTGNGIVSKSWSVGVGSTSVKSLTRRFQPPQRKWKSVSLSLLTGVVSCIMYALLNVSVPLSPAPQRKAAGEYTILRRACALRRGQTSFLDSMPLERPRVGERKFFWSKFERGETSGHRGNSLLGLDEVMSTGKQIAQDDACAARNASVEYALVRSLQKNSSYVVATRVWCHDGRILDRIVAVHLPQLSACTISLLVPSSNETRVNLVFGYSSRKKFLRDLLERAALPLARDRNLKLIIGAPRADVDFARRAVVKANLEGSASVVTVGVDSKGKFSRAIALQDAINTVAASELVFVIDAEMVFDNAVVRSCRLHAIRGSQVWFPIVFMGYPNMGRVGPGAGFWGTWGYGLVCFYQSDFAMIGGWGRHLKVRYDGWGPEDADLWARFRDNGRYGVLRSYEPGLFHLWHPKRCARKKNYKTCLSSAFREAGCGSSPRKAAGLICRQIAQDILAATDKDGE